jgi:hypothetical protein
MKLIKLFASAAMLACVLPSHSKADSYSLNIIELSDTQLSVTGTFPGYGPFSGVITNPAGDDWSILNGGNNGAVSGGYYEGPGGTNFNSLDMVLWLEPNSNPLNPTYNVFVFGYQPSGGAAEHIYVFSDLTVTDIDGNPSLNGLDTCGLGSNSLCPILLNGQTESGIPLNQTLTLNQLGTLDVTFTDQGDVVSATPLPSSWLMLLSGFVGLGFFAYRGSKKGSAALAAA